MADENNLHEEEYQFTDVDTGEPYVTETREVRRTTTSQTAVRNRVIFAIIVLLSALLIYKLFQWFYTPRVKAPETPVVVQPAQPVQPSVPASVTNSLSTLQQQANDQDTALKTLQSQVNELQTTLTQLNTSLTTLNSRLDTIQKQMTELEKPKPVIVKPKVVRPKRIYRPAPPPQLFFLKAIIPGRAWLKSENGTTITVSKGSFVPGYGRITRVSAQQGVVFTSSGRVIEYGPDDL